MMLRPSALLGAPRPWVSGEEELVERVRITLETRPGQLPWRPEFGCDLEGFTGQPATTGRLREVQWRIEQALARWLPEVTVDRCVVRVVPTAAPEPSRATSGALLAETALLGLGTQADLEVLLDLSGPDGPVALHAQLTP
jgi:phage baseplate assembly protein W